MAQASTIFLADVAVSEPQTSGRELLEERRAAQRVCRQFKTRLLPCTGNGTVVCTTSDLCEGGLYVQFPTDSGVTVGQRYEVMLEDESEAPDLAWCLTGGCYATIVRTEQRERDDAAVVGAGMRFDQPLML